MASSAPNSCWKCVGLKTFVGVDNEPRIPYRNELVDVYLLTKNYNFLNPKLKKSINSN